MKDVPKLLAEIARKADVGWITVGVNHHGQWTISWRGLSGQRLGVETMGEAGDMEERLQLLLDALNRSQ